MSGAPLTILWRGPLSGCNYDCGYCPFAKRKDSRAVLASDRAALGRFVDWVIARNAPTSVLFTPWGEALIRSHYQQAIIRLSQTPHVGRVAIQSNISAPLGWLADCDRAKTGIWATWHPSQISLDRFLARVQRLEALGISHSVGVVGVREHFALIEQLRATLPPSTYLWINAEEDIQGQYAPDEVERLVAVDPYFELNNRSYATLGRSCIAGHRSISVNGDGNARRCHFVDVPLGNIYDPGFEDRLSPSPCPKASCNCHIGYNQLDGLDLEKLFGAGFLERHADTPTRDRALQAMARFDRDDAGSARSGQAIRASIA